MNKHWFTRVMVLALAVAGGAAVQAQSGGDSGAGSATSGTTASGSTASSMGSGSMSSGSTSSGSTGSSSMGSTVSGGASASTGSSNMGGSTESGQVGMGSGRSDSSGVVRLSVPAAAEKAVMMHQGSEIQVELTKIDSHQRLGDTLVRYVDAEGRSISADMSANGSMRHGRDRRDRDGDREHRRERNGGSENHSHSHSH